jgi:hypothetical protein
MVERDRERLCAPVEIVLPRPERATATTDDLVRRRFAGKDDRPNMQAPLFATPQHGSNEDRGAHISADGQYRYRLWRIWDDLAPMMVWVLLNPSTADAETDDPTLRKCIGFAKHHRHGGVILVNLFAWRATNPKELPKVADPVGPDNDEHIQWAVRAPILATIVAGWGADKFAAKSRRATNVRVNIQSCGRRLRCFGKSNGGSPNHPLYLSYTTPLEDV